MEPSPAYRIPAGHFVIAELDGIRTVCLKAEREGKDHVNHFLVPLDPVGDRRRLALVYLDPERPLHPAEGYSLAFTPAAAEAAPDVGDALAAKEAVWLKLLDAPASQRLYCYVDLGSGQIRPRMERRQQAVLHWRLERI